jgi:eukaryotic-like serine/threonine-protein kinase
MPLSIGDKLGPYEILAKIGAGGMGEVYKARDTRLDRIVAIKVSAQQFTERFEREARAIAALNHPNICTLHDVGPNYLVMEFVEGQAPRGPMPLEDALRFASQIAEALAAAHEKNIVHRDLKPANIKIRPDGTVKVLDFGLAKALPEPSTAEEHSILSTDAMRLTQAGVVLGTPAYMAPEQASGKEVDKRADIWAFGVVLYELLAGERPFAGEDLAETLAAVLTKEPDLAQVPAKVRRLLETCLQKDPRRRLQAIGDARLLLEDVGPLPGGRGSVWSRLGWVAAGVLAAALVASLWMPWRQVAPEERAMRFEINPPPGAEFMLGAGGGAAISPDGRAIAFVAVSGGISKLWVRPLDSIAARELSGTDGAEQPFWSPDSRSLGFVSGGKLKRLYVTGGPPAPVSDAQAARGGDLAPGRNHHLYTGDHERFTAGGCVGRNSLGILH